MKRSRITAVALLLAAAMAFPFAACASGGGTHPDGPGGGPSTGSGDVFFGENEFVHDGIDRRYEFEDYDKDDEVDFEEDKGELRSYRYETENMLFTGSSSNGSMNWGHACLIQSVEFGTGFSGNICPKNLTNQYLTLTITSSKSVNVEVVASVSNTFGTQSRAGDSLDSYYTVTNSYGGLNHGVSLADAVIPEGGTQVTTNYFTMVETSFRMNLSEGVNTIVIQVRGGTNMDYLEFRTSAALGENTTPSQWITDAQRQVSVTAPTETRKGRLILVCSDGNKPIDLPVLTDPCYTKRVEDGETQYYLSIFGQEICVSRSTSVNPDPDPDPDPPTIPDVPQDGDFTPDPLPTQGEHLDVTHIKGQFNFWDPASWNSAKYSSGGSYEGFIGVPEVKGEGDGRYLEIMDASRIELFWVQDSDGTWYHLGDENAWNSHPESLYGQEFLYTFEIASDGPFDLELFSLRTSRPDRTNSDQSSRTGFYFSFNANTVCVYGTNTADVSATELQAVCTLDEGVDLTDGSRHSIAFSITRDSNAEGTYKLYIDGEQVCLGQPEGVHAYFGIQNGAMRFETNINKFGQRFAVIPRAGATVKIYALDILKVAPVSASALYADTDKKRGI